MKGKVCLWRQERCVWRRLCSRIWKEACPSVRSHFLLDFNNPSVSDSRTVEKMEKWCRNQPGQSMWTRLPASWMLTFQPGDRKSGTGWLCHWLRGSSAALLQSPAFQQLHTWTTSPWQWNVDAATTGRNFTLVVWTSSSADRRTQRRFYIGTHTSEAAGTHWN